MCVGLARFWITCVLHTRISTRALTCTLLYLTKIAGLFFKLIFYLYKTLHRSVETRAEILYSIICTLVSYCIKRIFFPLQHVLGCILFFCLILKLQKSAMVGNRTADRIESAWKQYRESCILSVWGQKWKLVCFGGMILFCSPLLILPPAPIPKPVILSELFEGDLFLWKMESSLKDDFI